jgi:hypothetical protein
MITLLKRESFNNDFTSSCPVAPVAPKTIAFSLFIIAVYQIKNPPLGRVK